MLLFILQEEKGLYSLHFNNIRAVKYLPLQLCVGVFCHTILGGTHFSVRAAPGRRANHGDDLGLGKEPKAALCLRQYACFLGADPGETASIYGSSGLKTASERSFIPCTLCPLLWGVLDFAGRMKEEGGPFHVGMSAWDVGWKSLFSSGQQAGLTRQNFPWCSATLNTLIAVTGKFPIGEDTGGLPMHLDDSRNADMPFGVLLLHLFRDPHSRIVHLCCSCRDCLKSLMQPWGMPITCTPAVLATSFVVFPLAKSLVLKVFRHSYCSQFLLHRLLWASNRKNYFFCLKTSPEFISICIVLLV